MLYRSMSVSAASSSSCCLITALAARTLAAEPLPPSLPTATVRRGSRESHDDPHLWVLRVAWPRSPRWQAAVNTRAYTVSLWQPLAGTHTHTHTQVQACCTCTDQDGKLVHDACALGYGLARQLLQILERAACTTNTAANVERRNAPLFFKAHTVWCAGGVVVTARTQLVP